MGEVLCKIGGPSRLSLVCSEVDAPLIISACCVWNGQRRAFVAAISVDHRLMGM